jgi:hypothetical protein
MGSMHQPDNREKIPPSNSELCWDWIMHRRNFNRGRWSEGASGGRNAAPLFGPEL